MKYYKLSVETEIKKIGRYPQIADLLGGGRVYQKANAQNFATISKWDESTTLPDFHLFTLHRKAKVTDFLSSNFNMSSSALILSKKAIKIFENFKIPNNKKWASTVYDSCNIKLDYTFLWHNKGESFIDFENSVFYKYERILRKFENRVNIDSKEQFKKEDLILMDSEGFYELYPKMLLLTEHFDLISFTGITAGAVCSEILKKTIEKANLTGFCFSEIDYIIKVKN